MQINAKLGGSNYKIEMEKPLTGKRIMVIGIDSRPKSIKINNEKIVSMVATLNNNLTDFYNESKIIKEYYFENKSQFCIVDFVEKATAIIKQKNKGNKPDWIIIYRQGITLQQKQRLKIEIQEIDNICENKNICYYYILVNTKPTFKFFEKEENSTYKNPKSGLLVLDGIVNRNFFEFYIQPQEVTKGSATPTCFHVAYGNLNYPEMIPKFTFDLCHLYSNWQGSIRIPHVIKCAEKLSKMTAKYKLNELNENLTNGQAYL